MTEAERILRFAAAFHAQSPWAGVAPLDDEAVLMQIAGMRANPNAFVEVTEWGCIAGVLVPLWFSPAVTLAVELFWYSEQKGEGRRLREAFEAWAIERGAHYSNLSCMVNDREETLRRMLGAAGYTAKEIGFIRAL